MSYNSKYDEDLYESDYIEEGYEDDYDGYESEDSKRRNKTILGYRIVIVTLCVILIALSVGFIINSNRLKEKTDQERQFMEREKTELQIGLDSMIVELESKNYQNDTMTARLDEARQLVEQLKRERTLNYNKLRQYEKEIGTLRTIMQGYIRQIDSLNTVNAKLTKDNIKVKKDLAAVTKRADEAEEKANELTNKVKMGAVLKAGGIKIVALKNNGKEPSRIKNATQLRVDFHLGGNELAEPGNKWLYICIYAPDGYLLANSDAASFSFEGDKKVYSARRDVDYQNEDLPVSIFYKDENLTTGTYKVEIYCDGLLIGQSEAYFK